MVNAICYTTISTVLDTWSKLRRIKNYEEVAGEKLFRRFFTACPAAKIVFGFLSDASPQALARDHRQRFMRHASVLIQMIETAINMLGPDIDTLTEIMTGLGRKHVSYGVTPDMFPILGQCLIDTLAECLNDDSPGSFRSEARDAWEEVYFNLSNDIMQAYSKENRRQSANI